MKKSLIITLSFIFIFTINKFKAQSVYTDTSIDKYISDIKPMKVSEESYIGTPYENETFQHGIISKNGVTISHQVGLRYNAHKDIFEIKKTMILKDNQATLLRKSDEIILKINNNTFVYIPASEKSMKSGYFVVLHKDEKFSLYKKIHKQFIPGQKAYNSLAQDVAPTFKDKTTLYVMDQDGKLIELPNSKGGKLKVFKDHKKEVKQFIKENKLNINKENNLVKLVTYYNNL